MNKRNNHTTQRSQTCSDTWLESDRLQLQTARIRAYELVQELIFRIFLIVDGFEVLEMLQRKLHDQSASCSQQTISLLFVLAKSQVRGLRGSEFRDEQRDDLRLLRHFCILHQRRFPIRSSLRPIQRQKLACDIIKIHFERRARIIALLDRNICQRDQESEFVCRCELPRIQKQLHFL